jgi:hypothetical protein
MLHSPVSLSRRTFLSAAAAGGTAFCLANGMGGQTGASARAATDRPLRIAAINSIFRLRSHAYHIVGRMVYGLQKDGFHHQPNVKVVRMMNDQTPPDDLSSRFCDAHGIELTKTVGQTLGENLDVDAVLLIIEHGEYPVNERGQVLYPRYEYFRRIVEVFQQTGRSVPVFVDKHLSYDRTHAEEMVATAKKLGFPLMAGSSLPVTWRVPSIEPPLDTPFTEGVCTFGFDRGTGEIYFIHALEVLQCMLERRKGGETGVKTVQTLQGDAVWKAIDADRISGRLVQAALDRCPSQNVGPLRENVLKPAAILVEYADGTRGAVLNLIEQTSEFGFAGSVQGRPEPVSTYFHLPSPPGARFFDPLTWNIEQFFHSGRPPYPVERTLLTSTMLDLAMHSLEAGGKVMAEDSLAIRYAPPADSGYFRGPVENQ